MSNRDLQFKLGPLIRIFSGIKTLPNDLLFSNWVSFIKKRLGINSSRNSNKFEAVYFFFEIRGFFKKRQFFFAFIFVFQLSFGYVLYSCKCLLFIVFLEDLILFYKINFLAQLVSAQKLSFCFRFVSFVPLLI